MSDIKCRCEICVGSENSSFRSNRSDKSEDSHKSKKHSDKCDSFDKSESSDKCDSFDKCIPDIECPQPPLHPTKPPKRECKKKCKHECDCKCKPFKPHKFKSIKCDNKFYDVPCIKVKKPCVLPPMKAEWCFPKMPKIECYIDAKDINSKFYSNDWSDRED
jgi:hypothetical protein